MAGLAGLEPADARVKVWCLNRLGYSPTFNYAECNSGGKVGWIEGLEPSASRATI